MWIFIVYLPNCNLFLVAKTVWGGFFLYNICHTLLSHFEFSKWVKFIFSPWRRRAEAQRLWRLFCVHLSSCVLSKTQDSNPDITCSRVNTKVLRNTLTFLSIVQIFLFSWKKKKRIWNEWKIKCSACFQCTFLWSVTHFILSSRSSCALYIRIPVELVEVCSLLALCQSWLLNSGCQSWWQAPLPSAEPSHWLLHVFVEV